jgi:hypothetical protein
MAVECVDDRVKEVLTALKQFGGKIKVLWICMQFSVKESLDLTT